jgi:uncharacterized protein YjdB
MSRWFAIGLAGNFVLVFFAAIVLTSCGGSSISTPTAGGKSSGGPVTLSSVQVSPALATIAQGTTQAFTAKGSYSDGSSKDLTAAVQWSCLLPNLATVSSTSPTQGLATANSLATGAVLITASLGSVSNSAQLTITAAAATSLAVTPATATIGFGDQVQYTATATFNDGSTQNVTNSTMWSMFSNTTFVNAPFISSASGFAIGESLGANTVMATFNGLPPATSPTLTVDFSNLISLAIVPANPSIANHTQIQFSVMGAFNDGSTRDVTSQAMNWMPSNYAIATNFGTTPSLFKAAGVGPVTITASVGSFTPSTTLTVTNATLQSVALTPANATLEPTTKLAYTATGTFSDGSAQDLTDIMTWFIQDNTGAASVTGKGLVTGVSPGSITVSTNSPFVFGSVPGATPATVAAGTLQSIAVKPASAFIVPGNTLQFSAIGTFSDGSTQDVSTLVGWTSSNAVASPTTTDVAMIASGLATGQGIGSTTITAKLGTISGTANLMVVSPSQVTLAVTPATSSLAAGATTQLNATGTFVDGSTQDFTTLVNWSSSNATAATVGYQTGVVSGLAAGTSTMTAALGSSTGTAQVTVH